MEYRTLGRTGVQVSPLCLGAMMFGSWGNLDHDDAIRIIHRALDAGINFIDTADVYSAGSGTKPARGRRRTPARPAGRPVEGPRVSGGTVQHRAGVGQVTDLGRSGEAHGHGAEASRPAVMVEVLVRSSRRAVLAGLGPPPRWPRALDPERDPLPAAGSAPAAMAWSTDATVAGRGSESRNTNALIRWFSRSIRSRQCVEHLDSLQVAIPLRRRSRSRRWRSALLDHGCSRLASRSLNQPPLPSPP